MDQFQQMDIFFIVTTVVVVFVGLLFIFVLYRIWRLLNLQLWGDLFITGRRDRWWDGIAVGSRWLW